LAIQNLETDINTYRLLNLANSEDTNQKSFYHSIIETLKEHFMDDEMRKISETILTKDLVKGILMPASYGSKDNKLIYKIIDSLKNQNNLSISEKRVFAEKLLTKLFDTCKYLNINIKHFVSVASKMHKSS
jgi:uncharacterized protein YfkK (UPF0435 family)